MVMTATTIIVALVIAWSLQYVFAFWQMKRFYGRIAQLHKLGSLAIGVSGSAWRRRQYAVLVVDKQQRVVRVEQLSGWTVMAALKPVPGLEGRPMSELFEEDVDWPVSDKLLAALQNAAGFIRDAAKRKAKRAQAEENRTEISTAVN